MVKEYGPVRKTCWFTCSNFTALKSFAIPTSPSSLQIRAPIPSPEEVCWLFPLSHCKNQVTSFLVLCGQAEISNHHGNPNCLFLHPLPGTTCGLWCNANALYLVLLDVPNWCFCVWTRVDNWTLVTFWTEKAAIGSTMSLPAQSAQSHFLAPGPNL